MPAGGEIKISSTQEAEDIVIEISDNGTGIDKSTVKQAFDPFFTTKPAGKGTGLGLAVCYGIITAHGGRIEIVSNEGAGTTFIVRLPLHP